MLSRSMAVLSPRRPDADKHQTLESALDALQAALVLLDRKGRALFVSHKAKALIAADDAVRVKNGAVMTPKPLEAAALTNLIATTLMKRGMGGVYQESPVYLSGAKGRLLRVSALPVAHSASRLLSATGRTAAVLLLLRATEVNARAVSQMLHWVYGLTGAEIRLALLLHGGRALAECARENSVSIETVRAQLKAIFQKTGVHRQSHLLRLLSELALPD